MYRLARGMRYNLKRDANTKTGCTDCNVDVCAPHTQICRLLDKDFRMNSAACSTNQYAVHLVVLQRHSEPDDRANNREPDMYMYQIRR